MSSIFYALSGDQGHGTSDAVWPGEDHQYPALFEENPRFLLTICEYLILNIWHQLKGLSRSRAKAEGAEIMQKLDLVDKQNTMSSKLSGGQKRKLSVAIALIGGSKVW